MNHRGQPKLSQINIYTDGSKTKNHAGAGIVIIKHGNLRHTESIKLSPNVTIFQSKAKAICKAAIWFKLNRNGQWSLYQNLHRLPSNITGTKHPHTTSKLIEDTITQLNHLEEEVKSLSIHWIEAHKGHAGKEKADQMAREAEYRTIIDESIDWGSRLWQKENIGSMLLNMDQRMTTCRMSKIFYPQPDKNKTKKLLKHGIPVEHTWDKL